MPGTPAKLIEFPTAVPPPRTLLLVDDEANILSALRRLLRVDGYHILPANNGADGLAVLESHRVDVIVSDQRMPGMTGVQFLSVAKTLIRTRCASSCPATPNCNR